MLETPRWLHYGFRIRYGFRIEVPQIRNSQAFHVEATDLKEQSNIAPVPACKTLHPRALKTCNLESPAR